MCFDAALLLSRFSFSGLYGEDNYYSLIPEWAFLRVFYDLFIGCSSEIDDSFYWSCTFYYDDDCSLFCSETSADYNLFSSLIVYYFYESDSGCSLAWSEIDSSFYELFTFLSRF